MWVRDDANCDLCVVRRRSVWSGTSCSLSWCRKRNRRRVDNLILFSSAFFFFFSLCALALPKSTLYINWIKSSHLFTNTQVLTHEPVLLKSAGFSIGQTQPRSVLCETAHVHKSVLLFIIFLCCRGLFVSLCNLMHVEQNRWAYDVRCFFSWTLCPPRFSLECGTILFLSVHET